MNACERGDESLSPAGFIVFDLPVILPPDLYQGRGKSMPRLVNIPVLAVRTRDGSVLVPDETVAWAWRLAEAGERARGIRPRILTIGRLFEFGECVLDRNTTDPEMVDLLVWNYLYARLENPVDVNQREFPHWQPVTYETVRNEFRHAVAFSRFCRRHTGSSSPFGAALAAGAGRWESAETNLSSSDFFAHLKVQRSRWLKIFGSDMPELPKSLKRRARRMGKSGSFAVTTTLSVDEVARLIRLEQNPVYRALWILLAFGGPRLSEALNLWRCDVLPGSYGRVFFSGHDLLDLPLVLFADPWESRYVGSFDISRSLHPRQEVLKARYGLEPRPDKLWRRASAGWKGMATFNPEWNVAWAAWTDRRKAMEFEALCATIRNIHLEARIEALHPYFFVNARNAEYFGEPTSIKAVEAAFERACARAGIRPHSAGASVHGLRHFYKWFAQKVLGLTDEFIQLMMRHVSIKSSKDYGKRSSDLYEELSKKLGNQGATDGN